MLFLVARCSKISQHLHTFFRALLCSRQRAEPFSAGKERRRLGETTQTDTQTHRQTHRHKQNWSGWGNAGAPLAPAAPPAPPTITVRVRSRVFRLCSRHDQSSSPPYHRGTSKTLNILCDSVLLTSQQEVIAEPALFQVPPAQCFGTVM